MNPTLAGTLSTFVSSTTPVLGLKPEAIYAFAPSMLVKSSACSLQ